MSMQDAVVNVARIWMNSYADTGQSPPRRGAERWPGRPGSGLFKCAPGGPDDYIYMTALARRSRMWNALLTAIGREDLIEDPVYSDPNNHPEVSDEINDMIEAWTMKHTKHEAMRILGEAGVPCSACLNADDIYNDPHLKERGMIVSYEHPESAGSSRCRAALCSWRIRRWKYLHRRSSASTPMRSWVRCWATRGKRHQG